MTKVPRPSALPTDAASLIAGVELGGTKAVAVIARGRRIFAAFREPTGRPADTLGALARRLTDWSERHGRIAALGVASFGPLGLNRGRADYGCITRTTKPGWSGVPVVEHFRRGFDGPIGFDTDVAGAALAESLWGAGVGQGVVVYVTIGTGIGGGLVVNGRPVHGLVHPEMGHLRVRRAPGDDFPGACPFHGDCLEGLASGPAIAARAGAPAETLGADNPVWPNVADEIAEMVVSLVLTLSPHRILIGGGVGLGKPFLLPMIRAAAAARLGGYAGLTSATLRRMVRAPALGGQAGPLGAVALGLSAMAELSHRGI